MLRESCLANFVFVLLGKAVPYICGLQRVSYLQYSTVLILTIKNVEGVVNEWIVYLRTYEVIKCIPRCVSPVREEGRRFRFLRVLDYLWPLLPTRHTQVAEIEQRPDG